MELGQFVLKELLYVFFQADMSSVYFGVTAVLTVIGIWGLFRKSGLPGWWALVPCAKDLKMGQIADREKEGRVAAVTQGVNLLWRVAGGAGGEGPGQHRGGGQRGNAG